METRVNKIKANVPDSSLPVLGNVLCRMKRVDELSQDATAYFFNINSASPLTLKIQNIKSGVGCFYTSISSTADLNVDNNVKMVNVSGFTQLYLSNGDYEVVVLDGKYEKITYLATTNNKSVVVGDYFPNDGITFAKHANANIDISRFAGLTSLEYLILTVSDDRGDVRGNIEDLGGCTALTQLALANRVKPYNVYGSLEGFVKNQVIAGRTSGTITMDWINSNYSAITFKGDVFDTREGGKFTWSTSGSTITLTLYHTASDSESTTISI